MTLEVRAKRNAPEVVPTTTRVHAEGVVLCERTCFCLPPSKQLLSAFYETLPSLRALLRTLSLLETLTGAF